MATQDITYNDLTPEEKRIYHAVRSKGYNVSFRAIRENAFTEAWVAQGAFPGLSSWTDPAFPTTTTTTTLSS